jgi:rhomboid protease GluP
MHTHTDIGLIECRSQAQALDHSLVLISQGIESAIIRCEEPGTWALEVRQNELRRATDSIDAYERENKVLRRREVKWTGLLFDARAALWFIALIFFHWFVAVSETPFKTFGMADRTLVLDGQWWRVFTGITLHSDLAHIASNAATGFVFLGLAMACYGAGGALLLSLLGGALGNVASLLLHPPPFSNVGASGFVMASLGLLTAHSLEFGRHEKGTIWIGRGVMAGYLLLVYFGFSPSSDVVAHVGGFIAGTVLGFVALRERALLLRKSCNIASGVLFLAILVLAWTLALRKS